MSEPVKDKPTVKKLPCGGYGVYGIDIKNKQPIQIGYIGSNLNVEAFLPTGVTVQDIKK